MKALVSGLVNIETTLKINSFPINYYPIDYPFFGINSNVSGVAYNVCRALTELNNQTELISFIGKDEEAKRIINQLNKNGIGTSHICEELSETPASVILYDNNGRRQIYCDLKDIQEKYLDCSLLKETVEKCDIAVVCNINFNRTLLKFAKDSGKLIACDVHVLSDIDDEYNKDFMQSADILFLSDEKLPCSPEKFIFRISKAYSAGIIAIGCGGKGAVLFDRLKNKAFKLSAVKVGDIVNTVGAGDALFSAFINYYCKGLNSLEAMKRAEIFASYKIGFNGASVGFPNDKKVEEYYNKYPIEVTEI